MLTVEAQQTYYFTDTSGMRNQQEGFTILHDRERDKWYLWNSDFIEGKSNYTKGYKDKTYDRRNGQTFGDSANV